jgi:hypothetical protein
MYVAKLKSFVVQGAFYIKNGNSYLMTVGRAVPITITKAEYYIKFKEYKKLKKGLPVKIRPIHINDNSSRGFIRS